MRTRCKPLLLGLLLGAAPVAALAADPAPAPAPPPPDIDDPGLPASAPIRSDDPRLQPLPPDAAPIPTPPADENAPVGPPKTDGDPTYAPRLPTDDAFHPPSKKPDAGGNAGVDGYSVRTYVADNGDKISEYRRGGQLTKVRVVPAKGVAYELRKGDDSERANRPDARDNKVEPVRFTLFEWH